MNGWINTILVSVAAADISLSCMKTCTLEIHKWITVAWQQQMLLCHFIEFSIQKSCSIKLKAIWRSQNYLPFTFSLEWIGMKRSVGNDGVKTLKTSVAKVLRKKQASRMITGRLDSRFFHCTRGKVWVQQPKEMFSPHVLPWRGVLTAATLMCSHYIHVCVWEEVGTGNQLQHMSFGHKGNKVSMSVLGARVNSQSTSVSF